MVAAFSLALGAIVVAQAASPPPAAAAPGSVPTAVYRSDQREPSEVFRDGFVVNGDQTNSNLFEHVSGVSNGDDTAFVSTTSDLEFALDWQPNAWVYKLAPTDKFYSVKSTFAAASESGTAEVATEAQRLLGLYEYQEEWASHGDISASQIEWAAPIIETDGLAAINIPKKEYNPKFKPEAKYPSTDPFPLDQLSAPSCAPLLQAMTSRLTLSAASCGARADEEVIERNQARWKESGDDTDFSLSRGEIEGGEHTFAPLPETVNLLEDSGNSIDGLGVNELKDALTADFSALDALSADAELLSKVARSAGKTLAVLGELLPYAGIAATGYALQNDLRSGDWVNAGFDGIAEALQVAEAAQPEFVPFLEPLLLVEVTVQILYGTIKDIFVESPAVRAWKLDVQQKETIHRRDWDAAVATLTQNQHSALTKVLEPALRSTLDESVTTRVAALTQSDLKVLTQLKHATIREAYRASHQQIAYGTPTEEAVAARNATVREIRHTFGIQARARIDAREAQGIAAYRTVATEATPKLIGSPAVKEFSLSFERTVAIPYIHKLSENLWLDFVYETRPPRVFEVPQQKYLDKQYEAERNKKLEEFRNAAPLTQLGTLPVSDAEQNLRSSLQKMRP